MKKFTFHDFFSISIIILCCFKLSFESLSFKSILFADEYESIRAGLSVSSRYLFRQGFIYFFWYKFLSLFTSDYIRLYCLNYILLISINPVLLYILFREMGRKYFSSFLFSLLFLISTANILTWPHITRFALLLILLILIFMIKIKHRFHKYLFSIFGLLLLIYIRPEFLLSLILFSIFSLSYFFYRFYKNRYKRYLYLSVITLLVLIFSIFIKNPTLGRRSIVAFGQHYALNLANKGLLKVDPWVNWEDAFTDSFQSSDTIPEAFSVNPRAMMVHIFENLKNFPSKLIGIFIPYNLKNSFTRLLFRIFFLILFLIAAFTFIINLKKQQKNWQSNGLTMKISTNTLLFYLIIINISVSSIVSALFINPRRHYLLILMAVIILTIAKNFPHLAYLKKFNTIITYSIFLVILYLTPWRASDSSGFYPHYKSCDIQKSWCANSKMLYSIRKLKIEKKYNLLAIGLTDRVNQKKHDKIQSYLGATCNYIHFWPRKVSFEKFVEENEINMIIVNRSLIRMKAERNDNSYDRFIKSSNYKGWKKVNISPFCCEYFLIHFRLFRECG